jgi:NitT/TauT family transport system substrate-binding protein
MRPSSRRSKRCEPFTALVIIALCVVLAACQSGSAGKVETINFGAMPGAATLVYIGQDQQFFAANGLTVNATDDYPSGVATTDALLNGDIDIAWTAEYPMVGRAFEQRPIRIIASDGRFTTCFLLARTDRGITLISDLKGKTIGVPRKTINEFYMMRFLALNGVNLADVSLVDVPAAQALEQITSGSVDGVAVCDPNASPIRAQLGDRGVVWPIQSSQPGYGLFVARNDWISALPETTTRFIKSLAQAEDFLIINPAEAKAILQERLGLDDAAMQTFWPEIQPFLALDQSLILALEDEARWMIANHLTAETQVPNFLDYIYEDGLKAARPDAVRIVR